MGKAIFKFYNGRGALLCSRCSKIIKEGWEMTQKEKDAMGGVDHLEDQYCSEECKKKHKSVW